MKNILFILFLFCSINSLASQGGFPRTGILPELPMLGDNVRLGIESSLNPCYGFYEETDVFYHLSDDNHITFVVAAVGVNPCPNIPGFGYQYNVGELPAGDYTVQIYIVNFPGELPQTINDPLGFTIDDGFSFTVRGSATPVPAMSWLGTLILLGFVLFVVFVFIKRKTHQTI